MHADLPVACSSSVSSYAWIALAARPEQGMQVTLHGVNVIGLFVWDCS